MSRRMKDDDGTLMEILAGLTWVLRCCCRDEAFCEGVTFHQFMILDAVAAAQELPMADLHNLLSVEKSTTTRLVNPLIKRGLLLRETTAHDSRAVKLTLTPKGSQTRRKVRRCLAGFFRKVMNNLPADESTEILASVNLFIAAVKKSANVCDCR